MQRGYGNLSETVHIALSLGGKQNSVLFKLTLRRSCTLYRHGAGLRVMYNIDVNGH